MSKQLVPTGGRMEETRRTARILEIIHQIARAPGYWSGKRLAEYHEVSSRMIGKDIEIIRHKLRLELKHNGSAYLFVNPPHLPMMTYSFGEALALITAARLAQTIPGVNSADLAAAIARLEMIFPKVLRPLLQEAADQLPQKAHRSHRQDMLTLLHRARIELRQVEITYETSSRKGKSSKRVVEPYELIPYGRSWQLIAFDHMRNVILQFKIDRIQLAELTSDHYTIPEDFDVDVYMGDSWGAMRGESYQPEEVVLIFEPEPGRWAAEESWHKSQEIVELDDGRIEMRFLVGITPEMVSWLLYYGENVFVERPLWLREEVRRRHEMGMKKQEQNNA